MIKIFCPSLIKSPVPELPVIKIFCPSLIKSREASLSSWFRSRFRFYCIVYFFHICLISEVCRSYQSFNAYIAPVIILAFRKPFQELIICHIILSIFFPTVLFVLLLLVIFIYVFRVKIILTSDISVFRGKFGSLSFHLDMILFIFPVYQNFFKFVVSEHS